MDRDIFVAHALEVAPQLLGASLTVGSDDGPVTIRITEVEAYHGAADPAAHAYRGWPAGRGHRGRRGGGDGPAHRAFG